MIDLADVKIHALGPKQSLELSVLAKKTFVESHGHSASEKDIQTYLESKLNASALMNELEEEKNLFYGLFQKGQLIGYSKVIMNLAFQNQISDANMKMERLYLLKEFYGMKLGEILLNFNLELAKKHNQKGVWLYVWVENQRAIDFYKKNGFETKASADFKISENHVNPNHIMLLTL